MSHMQMFIYNKGSLYSCDCSRCQTTYYSHEWTDDTVRNSPQEWAAIGPMRGVHCPECGGEMDLETFAYHGRQYAGRYSAPGYMDCTDWHYSPNLRTLKRELRAMYCG